MAEPINHDMSSTVGTVAGSAAKYGLMGAVASFVVPALVVGGIAGLVVAATPIASAALAVGITAGAIAGFGGAIFGGSLSILGGALFGVAKGGDRVSAENQEFRKHMQNHMRGGVNRVTQAKSDGEIAGIQEGYQIGFNDGLVKGQEAIISQLQQHAMEAQAQQAAPEEKPVLGQHTAAVASCTAIAQCGSQVEKLTKQSEARAAVANQLGA